MIIFFNQLFKFDLGKGYSCIKILRKLSINNSTKS